MVHWGGFVLYLSMSNLPSAQTPLSPESESPSEDFLSVGGLFLEMAKVIVLAIVIIIPIRVFLFQPFFVQGASMDPNFEDGQYLIISEFGYKHTDIPGIGAIEPFRDFERQEPVVFRYPKNPEQFYIKRVIGLPGEAVEIKKGVVYIYNEVHHQGFALDESAYLDPGVKTSDMTKMVLSEDEYFVMGDNRAFSYDSRAFGPIHKKELIGRVLLRAWPVGKFSLY